VNNQIINIDEGTFIIGRIDTEMTKPKCSVDIKKHVDYCLEIFKNNTN
jgi:hypothetical protein